MEIVLTRDLAAKLAGVDPEKLSEALLNEEGGLKEGAADEFASMVVSKFKEAEKSSKEQQYNRGLREKAEAFERSLGPILERFGIEKADRVEETIQALGEALTNVEAGKGTPDLENLTLTDLKKLPAYEEAVKDIRESWERKYGELETAHNDFVNAARQEKLHTAVMRETRRALEEAKAANANDDNIEFTWNALGLDNVRLTGDGALAVTNGNGEPQYDQHGNPLRFEDYVKNNWRFGFNDAPPGGSPLKPDRGQSGSSELVITSEDQYNNLLKSPGELKRSEIHAAWSRHISENS